MRPPRPFSLATTPLPRTFAAALLVLGTFSACGNDGVRPPEGRLNFPTAAALSLEASPRFIYVANSNFDLRYNKGSIQTYNLEVFADAVLECTDRDPEDCVIIDPSVPSLDADARVPPIEANVLVSEVLTGSYADGVTLSPSGARLYTVIRSDGNLTTVDVDPATGALSCGGEGQPHICTEAFRAGDDDAAALRDINLPPDPVDVVSGSLTDFGRGADEGDYVFVTHRGGQASLFIDDNTEGSRPTLIHSVGGLAPELVSVAFEPRSQLFWLTSGGEPRLSRVGVAIDGLTQDLERSFLFNAGDLRVSDVDTGDASTGDTRDVVFDPREDVERAYVLSRRPEALFFANLRGSGDLDIAQVVEVGDGPSRVTIHDFEVDGEPRWLLFVSCFESRDLYVIDADNGRLLGTVGGLSGPFEVLPDPSRERVYVVDFRSSVVRAVDLSAMLACISGEPSSGELMRECAPRLLGMIGQPRPVMELL